MIKYYSINGQLVPKEEASLGVTDLALIRGYGLFDFFLVKQGQPLFFDDYLDRYYHIGDWYYYRLFCEYILLRHNGDLC